tara:strand:+ start:3988 stop:4107 length:120 start_codon:yes stop_codon:yes gene_type:complete
LIGFADPAVNRREGTEEKCIDFHFRLQHMKFGANKALFQ